jgi:HlyD family secretion protein
MKKPEAVTTETIIKPKSKKLVLFGAVALIACVVVVLLIHVSGARNDPRFVDYNSVGHKGQVLAKLDPTSFQEAVDQANATLAQARAQAAAQASTVTQNAANAQNMIANEQQLEGGTAQVAGANATVQVSKSQAAAAGTDCCRRRAGRRNRIQSGANRDHKPDRRHRCGPRRQRGADRRGIAANPNLVVIASSLKDMEVEVSVDEADAGQLRAGQTAYITVPAYPKPT